MAPNLFVCLSRRVYFWLSVFVSQQFTGACGVINCWHTHKPNVLHIKKKKRFFIRIYVWLLKYQQKHLPSHVAPPCSARVFDLVAAQPEGVGSREWLGMAVKSPSDNELSSADWSSHTFTQTSSSWATDLLFRLMPYNVFIHNNVRTLNILHQTIQNDLTLLSYTRTYTVLLRVKPLTFQPLWSKVSTNQESKTEQKGQWTPLTVHYSALTPLVCVCQQVKSPSIGTTETHWIDSNDWFHPFTPPPSPCVFLSTSKLKSESESRVAGHDSNAQSTQPDL